MIFFADLSRRASVKVDGHKSVAFENNNGTGPGDAMGNSSVISKPKSRSGSIIGAISPIMGTGKAETYVHFKLIMGWLKAF